MIAGTRTRARWIVITFQKELLMNCFDIQFRSCTPQP